DNKIYIIDLKAKPAKLINTIEGDKQPSGLSINPAGTLALVANRAGKSISVLSIHGTDVKLVGSVDMGDEVSAVVFTPDGKHALASKASANKVALLDVDGDTVTYNKKDILTGLFPYNVVVGPSGDIALTADNGNNGTSDGNVDTVSVIDLTAPVHVIDHITVPDRPAGLRADESALSVSFGRSYNKARGGRSRGLFRKARGPEPFSPPRRFRHC